MSTASELGLSIRTFLISSTNVAIIIPVKICWAFMKGFFNILKDEKGLIISYFKHLKDCIISLFQIFVIFPIKGISHILKSTQTGQEIKTVATKKGIDNWI